MKEQPSLKEGAPLLLPGARIECRPGTSLPLLHLPTGTILVNDAAAAVLGLCNGRHNRLDIQLRLMGLGYPGTSAHLDAFLDSARERRWIVDLKLPVVQSFQLPACAEL